jgi:copper(I)-binding protein
MPSPRRFALALAVPVALATFAGCSSDDTTDTGDTTTSADAGSSTTTTAAGTQGGEASAEGIEVTGAWARTSPAMADAGAAYLTITSEETNALVGASVPSSVAGKVEIHETVMADDSSTTSGDMESGDMGSESSTTMGDMSSDTTAGGMGEMTMVPVDKIDLPAGEAVELKPGGLHIMLLALPAPLEVGTDIELTLTFETGEPLTVTVPVLDEAPAA